MDKSGVSEQIIIDSGCGSFQIILVTLIYILAQQPKVFTMMFLSFGIYNPGWRCLDQNSSVSFERIGPVNETMVIGFNQSKEYTIGSCSLYESCRHIEFDPKTRTIVTEWGLICDKEWVASLIISLQMFGWLVGSLISGQAGDMFGRKKVLYGSFVLVSLGNLFSAFSPNWQVFAAFRFFIGLFLSSIVMFIIIFPTEFLNPLWRSRLPPIPAWHFGGILFSLIAMWCEDWVILHIITAVAMLVCCVSAVWVPESIRWLEIKQKRKEYKHVVEKIYRLNKKPLRTLVDIDQAFALRDSQAANHKIKKYTMKDLFRRGFRLKSLILGFLFASMGIAYFSISFGIKSMSGDIYINLIIMFGMEIPYAILPVYAPNLIGRRNSALCFFSLATICMFVTTGLELFSSNDDVRKIGTLIFALLAKTNINAVWYILYLLIAEMYPTVVRGVAIGYAGTAARVGGILAPLLIPSSPDTLHIPYLIMGILGTVCCILHLKLPETKGKKMVEMFPDEESTV